MFGDLKVKDIMRKTFARCQKNESVRELLKKLKGEQNIAVVFDGKRPIGEIDELNLIKVMVNPRKVPKSYIVEMGFGVDFDYFAKTARDIMDPIDISVGPEDTITDAIILMDENDVKSLPVIDREGRSVGVISDNDIVEAYVKRGYR